MGTGGGADRGDLHRSLRLHLFNQRAALLGEQSRREPQGPQGRDPVRPLPGLVPRLCGPQVAVGDDLPQGHRDRLDGFGGHRPPGAAHQGRGQVAIPRAHPASEVLDAPDPRDQAANAPHRRGIRRGPGGQHRDPGQGIDPQHAVDICQLRQRSGGRRVRVGGLDRHLHGASVLLPPCPARPGQRGDPARLGVDGRRGRGHQGGGGLRPPGGRSRGAPVQVAQAVLVPPAALGVGAPRQGLGETILMMA